MDLILINDHHADLLATPGVTLRPIKEEVLIIGPQGERLVSIDRRHIAAKEGALAWIERTRQRWTLVVHDGHFFTQWRCDLPGSADEEGFAIALLAWSGDHVVTIYRGEHHLYICAAHDLRMAFIEVLGEAFTVHPDQVLFSAYGPEAEVHRFSLPHLERMERIPAAQARALGIVPLSVHHPDHRQHIV